jgi:glycosyltransferase involved in cell wall biosynthesis
VTVSIIIKTLNEEKNIARTIEHALAALAALPGGNGAIAGEVILADSGSRDRTVEIASCYPVRIVQIEAPARPSCGIGPQLGFQYARNAFVCLIDGDMDLDPEFLPDALAWLDANAKAAGVTGHVEEMMLGNLEYTRRVQRNAPENRTGPIDRMNGGGLYRKSAIEKVGYLTDRNLHGYEEFDLGIRLRHSGFDLFRMDRRFVRHYGHNVNSYKLLLRRWKTKYLFGIGEVLRAATGKPYFGQMLKELPELKLWALVWAWILVSMGLIAFSPSHLAGLGVVILLFVAIVALMSQRKGSFSLGLYTVVAWLFHAAALPVGYCATRRDPKAWVESRPVGGQNERSQQSGPEAGMEDGPSGRAGAVGSSPRSLIG